MSYRTPPQIRELHIYHSPYAITKSEQKPYDSLLQWPSNAYFNKFRSDAALLKHALTTYAIPDTSTVASQVFGAQTRDQRIGLQHKSNVLYERAELHAKHLKEIDRHLMDCYERLSILKMHFPIDGGRTQQNLEKTVLQLEQERRTEEVNFWKDTAEIRDKLFENAATYKQAKHRYSVFSDVEDYYGR